MPTNGNNNGLVPVTTTGQGPGFPVTTGLATVPGYAATGPIKGATVPYWFVGHGKPQIIYQGQQFPIGTMYCDQGSTPGNTLFVFIPLTGTSGPTGHWAGIT